MRFLWEALLNNNSASHTVGKNGLFKFFNFSILISDDEISALLAAKIIGLERVRICLLNMSKSSLVHSLGFLIKFIWSKEFLINCSLIDRPESLLDNTVSILCFRFSLSRIILSQSLRINERIQRSNSSSMNLVISGLCWFDLYD